jgi:hypothetical protein
MGSPFGVPPTFELPDLAGQKAARRSPKLFTILHSIRRSRPASAKTTAGTPKASTAVGDIDGDHRGWHTIWAR